MPTPSSVARRSAIAVALAISAAACTGQPSATPRTESSKPAATTTPATPTTTPATPTTTAAVSPAPSGTTAYTSPVYGYTIQRPAAWTVTPATAAWPAGARLDGHQPAWLDRFDGSWSDPSLRDFDGAVMAAQPLPAGVAPATWTETYAKNLESSSRDCKGTAAEWTKATIGSIEVNRIDLECFGIRVSDVAFVVNGTGYVISGGPSVVTLFVQTFQAGA